ncbi:peptidoglycan-binding protein [Streptomyces sp. NPDC048419]|uniref:peptidoglycan-binding domain-containing protein n=1 Tax=Streptomyces sp. NPDC048419 TaxID=3365547 RepID=UPI00371C0CB3
MTMRRTFALATVTGALGAGLVLGSVGSASARPDMPNVGRGDSGVAVLCVQHGYNDWAKRTHHHRISEDRDFGSKTASAVRLFQQKSHLHVDGVVGKKTGNSLLDNLQGDGGWRSGCYEHLPSTHR